MSYYNKCPHCGAALDSGEKCTCANEKAKESYEAGGRYYPVAFQNCRSGSFVCPRRQHASSMRPKCEKPFAVSLLNYASEEYCHD